MRTAQLIVKVNGSYPMAFNWGGKCGNEQVGGFTIEIGKLCRPDTPKKNFRFSGGGVMHREDAKKLMELIKEGLKVTLPHEGE